MIDKTEIRDAWSAIWPFIPPAIGAWFGLRYAVEQSRRERVATWFCAAFLALWLGEAVGEHFGLGTKATAGATILVAMLLSDLVGLLVAVLRQWTADPVGTFRRWRDAITGRGGQP